MNSTGSKQFLDAMDQAEQEYNMQHPTVTEYKYTPDYAFWLPIASGIGLITALLCCTVEFIFQRKQRRLSELNMNYNNYILQP
jgi:hypothetical protein